MKKILFTFLLLFPISVFAAYPAVTELTASISGNTISYSGKIEDGSTAVMCKLLNENDEELDMLSSSVSNNDFDGAFTVSSSGNYKVACANYEGGEIKTVSAGANATYTITFDPNGGEMLDINIPSALDEGTTLDLQALDESQVKPPKGKVFDAYEINGVRYEVGSSYTVNTDTTIKILWKDSSNAQTSKTNNPKTYDEGIKRSIMLVIISLTLITISMLKLKRDKKKASN